LANETVARVPRGPAFFLAAIVIAAFMLRYAYVRTAVVDDPLRGDAWQYFCYAWNLLNHGTFSLARPLSPVVTPDSFRDPGYPAFLAGLMALRGTGPAVYDAILFTQCVLGTATVGLCMSLARRYRGMAAAVATGVLLAFWPHLVGFAGYVLSETLLGFLIALALWLLDTSLRRRSIPLAAMAGLAFSAAALTNAVVLPMAPLLCALMLWKDVPRRRLWLALLLACALPPAAWTVRNAMLPPTTGASARASINLVQGAWPEYHQAAFDAIQRGDPQAQATMAAIDQESRAMQAGWTEGLPLLWRRLSADPWRYAGWYASKPALLWGWNVAVGQGDIYVFPTAHSLFEDSPVLHAWEGICYVLNPWIALLALIGTLDALLSRNRPLALRWMAAVGILATLTFTLLQAEPRYAVPYRGIEILLAVSGARMLWQVWKHRSMRASA